MSNSKVPIQLPNSGSYQLGPLKTMQGQSVSTNNLPLITQNHIIQNNNNQGMLGGVMTYYTPRIYEHMLDTTHVGHCVACREDNKNLAFEYGSGTLKRQICEFCYLAWMDRKFGIQTESATLEALHGKTRET